MINERIKILKIFAPSFERGLLIEVKTGQIIRIGDYEDPFNEPKVESIIEGYLLGIGEIEPIANRKIEVILSGNPLNQVLDVIGFAKNITARTIDIESSINVTMEHTNMKEIVEINNIKEGDLIHLSHPAELVLYNQKVIEK